MTGESQDSRNMAVLVWIGTIFLWFVPGLLAYLLKRDDAYVRDHGVEAVIGDEDGLAVVAQRVFLPDDNAIGLVLDGDGAVAGQCVLGRRGHALFISNDPYIEVPL